MNFSSKNIAAFIVQTAVGVAILLWVLLGHLNLSKDFSSGIIWGVSSGFIAVGIAGIAQSIYMSRHPEKARAAEIVKNEERNVMIRTKTHAAVYYVSIYAECAVILAGALTGFMEVAIAFFFLLVIQIVCFCVFATYYSKKY
jgi:hypothetical protein